MGNSLRTFFRRFTLVGGLALTTLATGCAGGYAIVQREPAVASGLSWYAPISSSEQRTLDRWADAVGPPFIRPAKPTSAASDYLLLVSWNTSVGDADVVELVRRLRTSNGADVPLVLLLQEALRTGGDVPATMPESSAFASRLGHRSQPLPRDIAAIAAATNLGAYYVPSMRNGGAPSNEDRGNAILSNLPLTDLAAIELPFERQRRVAVAATIVGRSSHGTQWQLRVVSAHLDNMVGPGRLWFAGGEYARARQARALVLFLADARTAVLGGDFNTWFGFADQAYRETAIAFPGSRPQDRRPTFRNFLRLDHLFLRLPDGWRAHDRRGNDRLGSDHYPLISTVTIAVP